MGNAALTIVPVKDMRYAGQLLSYALTEYKHKAKINYSGLPISLYSHTGDWLSYLQQLNQTFNQQQHIQHDMESLPDMQDWSNYLALNKLHQVVTLRLPKLANPDLLLQLIKWSASVKRKKPSVAVFIAVSPDVFANSAVLQALLDAGNKVNNYHHDGQHHKFEPEFQHKVWQPVRAIAATLALTAIAGLWFWAQPALDTPMNSSAAQINHQTSADIIASHQQPDYL